MAAERKTIYIDIDDEITGVIDKVRAAEAPIVALVLPKRASVFQSIVNMKLLKKSAEEAKKRVVLITSEAGLLPLAGAVGLHVAKTLQSKPEIPPSAADETPAAAEEALAFDNTPDSSQDFDQAAAANKPVGELASAEPAPTKPLHGVETLELDNTEPTSAATDASSASPASRAPQKGKNKKLKVPNFNKFRLRTVLGVAIIIILIGLWILAFKVLPRAHINVQTDAQAVNSSLTLTLDSQANNFNPNQLIVPATIQQEQKKSSQQVPATGQKDEGTKATGSITMSVPCSSVQGSPPSIPAGTGVSAAGLTFITQSGTSLTTPSFSNGCQFTGTTNVVAQQNGSQYNLGPRSDYTVAGFSGVSAADSSGMSGGTSKIVTVVSQSDIDGAKQKIGSQDSSKVKQQLEAQLKSAGLFAIPATFTSGTPDVTTSANVGDSTSNVTVTENITYSMFGVQKSDLKALVDNDVKSQINTSKQTILDEGLDGASFKVINASATSDQVSMFTTATAGPDLNKDQLKSQIAGKKSGDIQSIIKGNPGVTGVSVHFSPFWVSHAPSSPSKITINFAKPTPPSGNSSTSSN